jgi:phosphotransferase system  glucose/maltose/N-acetylglucosamine-specific IIC component
MLRILMRDWFLVLLVLLLFFICYYFIYSFSIEVSDLKEEIRLLNEENLSLMEDIRKMADRSGR